MLNNSQDKGYSTKQEDKGNESKLSKGSSSSRSQWSGLKDPRVVRVSRSFGGKDRHSKVCTIRGLRDRRVRLSVPTAIQLYDLQDRLGLNQPSKVVDWLLNVAKHEIDELPPLPISPENFTQYAHSMKLSQDQVSSYQSSLASLGEEDLSHSLSSKDGFKINDNIPQEENQAPKSTFWNLNAPLRSEESAREDISDKINWFKRNEPESQGSFHGLPHNILPRPTNNTSFSGLLNNVMPYNSFHHWDPSSLSLSQFGSHGFSVHNEDPHSSFMLCSSGTAPSFFSPYATTQVDQNQRQINHLQLLTSTSQNLMENSLTPNAYHLSQSVVRPLQLGLGPNFPSPQNQNADQLNKGSSTGTCFPNDPKSTFG